MPSSPSESAMLNHLTYVVDQNPVKEEPHGGSDFGGYPSLKQRNDSFDIRESMEVHCGFVPFSSSKIILVMRKLFLLFSHYVCWLFISYRKVPAFACSFIRFVKGVKPGRQTGFDIDEADIMELEQFHEVIVASAIFGIFFLKAFLWRISCLCLLFVFLINSPFSREL